MAVRVEDAVDRVLGERLPSGGVLRGSGASSEDSGVPEPDAETRKRRRLSMRCTLRIESNADKKHLRLVLNAES